LRWTGRSSGRAGGGTDLENQPRASLRITDRDRLTGVDVDPRHPRAVDVHAAGAAVDGHPMGPGEPQHHVRARWRRWGGAATRVLQRDVDPLAVADQHVAAGGKDVSHRSDPYGQRGGRKGGCFRPHHRRPSQPVRPNRSRLDALTPLAIDSSVYPPAVVDPPGGAITGYGGAAMSWHSQEAAAAPRPPPSAPRGPRPRAGPIAVQSQRRGRPERR
jgi:hypothetical protein